MKISKTVEMKHFMVYRYLVSRHPDQNERYLKLRTIYPHGQAEILFGVRIILANGNGCKKESETSFCGTVGEWGPMGPEGPHGPWGGGRGWGGGGRGASAG